jgi:hypothetical protein
VLSQSTGVRYLDAEALLGEPSPDVLADTARRPGDNGNLVFQSHGSPPSEMTCAPDLSR